MLSLCYCAVGPNCRSGLEGACKRVKFDGFKDAVEKYCRKVGLLGVPSGECERSLIGATHVLMVENKRVTEVYFRQQFAFSQGLFLKPNEIYLLLLSDT